MYSLAVAEFLLVSLFLILAQMESSLTSSLYLSLTKSRVLELTGFVRGVAGGM